MLPIIVKGKGLIPRGHGIAPKLDPFYAGLNTITLIMNTRGMSVEFVDPRNKKSTPLTRDNFRQVYDEYQKSGGPQHNPSPVMTKRKRHPGIKPDLVPGAKEKSINPSAEGTDADKVDDKVKDATGTDTADKTIKSDQSQLTPPPIVNNPPPPISAADAANKDAAPVLSPDSKKDDKGVEAPKNDTPIADVLVKEDKVEEKKDDEFSIRPVVKDDNKPSEDKDKKDGKGNNWNRR